MLVYTLKDVIGLAAIATIATFYIIFYIYAVVVELIRKHIYNKKIGTRGANRWK